MRSSGQASPRPSRRHVLWSALGGFLGILAIERLGFLLGLTGYGPLFLIGSFGASAVLIYGVPQAEFSQPRNVVGGHVISALIGVLVFQSLGNESIWAFPLSVSLAIVAQQMTRTVHPPGGATALIALLGGDPIHELGFLYPFCPVMLGSLVMVGVAALVNNLSGDGRRSYPVYWW